MKRLAAATTDKWFGAVFILLLAVYFVFVYQPDFNKGPNGIHAWAQADHYALAKGFVNNDLQFFQPETYVCNHQFPDYWKTDSGSSVTAVDFPIHNYIPAVIMKITGSDSPIIYRIYLLLVGLMGAFFLFRLATVLTGNRWMGVFITVFFVTSPVYTYYQIRFLPGIPSLATAITGLYFYFIYRRDERHGPLIAAMIFLTLGALTRTTFLIPLIAVLAVEFFRLFQNQKDLKLKILLVAISGGLILGYMAWNAHLRSAYGSLFLSTLMPVSSFAEFLEITAKVYELWHFEYFSRWHYLVIALLVVLAVVHVIRSRKLVVRGTLPALIGFMLIGCLLFYIVLCAQFINHDYYFIDVFFIPLILIICALSRFAVPDKRLFRWLFLLVGIGFSALALRADFKVQQQRAESERFGLNAATDLAYKGSEAFLDRLGISKSEKLLVITPAPPNVPFMAMNRKGYITMGNKPEVFRTMLDFPVKYVVFQNELFMQEVFANYPAIINGLEVVATNGKITLCRKTVPTTKNLYQFLQLDKRRPVFSAAFSDTTNTAWECFRSFNETEQAWEYLPENDYGPVLKLRDSSWFNTDRIAFVEGEIKWDRSKDIQFSMAFAEQEELLLYKTFSLQKSTKESGEWMRFQFMVPVPASSKNPRELSVGFLNDKHTQFYIRNLKVSLY